MILILAILIIFEKLKRKFIAIYNNITRLSVKFWQIEYDHVLIFPVKLIKKPCKKREKLTNCSRK